MKQLKPILTVDLLQYIYQILIKPHFDYYAMMWRNCNRTLKEKLQELQNRAAGVITGNNYDVPSETILSKLVWKPLEEKREIQTMSYMSNLLKRNCPEIISKMFTLENNETYNLRSNNNMLMLWKIKTNAIKRIFSYSAAKIRSTHL